MVNGKLALAAAVLGALQLSLCLASPVAHSVSAAAVAVASPGHAVGVVAHSPPGRAVGFVAGPSARTVGVRYVGFGHDDDGFGDDDDFRGVAVVSGVRRVW
ncbi:uncharacterized protein LOC125035767 [Penaeus chinensis]|uniref:uncharacterized protein LOC125035767 n=1 Tax=Penaeus chinensis TaxID=139456 RepID=UPI001FB67EDA|nr:uncharacterized protein LOC125035767 [Penaeus chinensis]